MTPVSELLAWVPHREPMVWIDGVTQFSEDGGECTLQIRNDAGYMGPQGLRESSLIEFMAQAHAFISICHNRLDPSKKPPEKAFLAAIREATFAQDLSEIRDGTQVQIQTSRHRIVGPISLFNAEVRAGSRVLAQASFKVFAE